MGRKAGRPEPSDVPDFQPGQNDIRSSYKAGRNVIPAAITAFPLAVND
jgi:hypothetical protein